MLLVPLHFTLFIRFCLPYLDHVISTPLMWKKNPVRIRQLPTMKGCHEVTDRCISGDTAADRNPHSEIAHLACGMLGNRCLSRGGSATCKHSMALHSPFPLVCKHYHRDVQL